MAFGLSDSRSQKGEEKNRLIKTVTQGNPYHPSNFCVQCSLLGSPLTISCVEYINCHCPSSSLPHLFHTALTAWSVALKYILIKMVTLPSVAYQGVFPCELCLQNPSKFNLSLPLPPKHHPPHSTHGPAKLDHCLFPALFYFCPCSCHSICCSASSPHLCLLQSDSWLHAQLRCLLLCAENISWPAPLEARLPLNS